MDVNIRDGPDLFQVLELLSTVGLKRATDHEAHKCDSPGPFLTTSTKVCVYSTWKVFFFCTFDSSMWTPILLEGLNVRRAVFDSLPPRPPFSVITYPLPSPFVSPLPTCPSGWPEESNSSVIYKCEVHLLRLDPGLCFSPMLTMNVSLQAFQVSCLHGHNLH